MNSILCDNSCIVFARSSLRRTGDSIEVHPALRGNEILIALGSILSGKAERRGRPKGSLAGAFGHKRTVGKLRDVLATWQYLRLAIRRGPSEAYQSANSMHFSIYPSACLRDLLISNVINFANSPACSASSGSVAPCVEPLSWTIKRGVEASRVVERYLLMARTVAGFIAVTLIGLGFSALRHVEVS